MTHIQEVTVYEQEYEDDGSWQQAPAPKRRRMSREDRINQSFSLQQEMMATQQAMRDGIAELKQQKKDLAAISHGYSSGGGSGSSSSSAVAVRGHDGSGDTVTIRRGVLKHMADCIDRACAAASHAVL